MPKPTIIILPNGDAILATTIQAVYAVRAIESLGVPDRLCVRSSAIERGLEIRADSWDHALNWRDAIIAEWRAAIAE